MIMMSTETPRGKWPLGRVVKAFPGKDDRVCVVDVQKTVYRRPISETLPVGKLLSSK